MHFGFNKQAKSPFNKTEQNSFENLYYQFSKVIGHPLSSPLSRSHHGFTLSWKKDGCKVTFNAPKEYNLTASQAIAKNYVSAFPMFNAHAFAPPAQPSEFFHNKMVRRLIDAYAEQALTPSAPKSKAKF